MDHFKAVGLSLLFVLFLLIPPCLGADSDVVMAGSAGVKKTESAKTDTPIDVKKEQQDEADKAPSIRFEAPDFTFDKAVEGVEITHDFVVKNTGNAPLYIQKVRTG